MLVMSRCSALYLCREQRRRVSSSGYEQDQCAYNFSQDHAPHPCLFPRRSLGMRGQGRTTLFRPHFHLASHQPAPERATIFFSGTHLPETHEPRNLEDCLSSWRLAGVRMYLRRKYPWSVGARKRNISSPSFCDVAGLVAPLPVYQASLQTLSQRPKSSTQQRDILLRCSG